MTEIKEILLRVAKGQPVRNISGTLGFTQRHSKKIYIHIT